MPRAPERRFRPVRWLAALAVVLGAWAALAPFLAERLVVTKRLARADAIVVLGGGGAYLPRALEAAFLYKEGVAPRVLLTDDGELAGWDRKEERTPPFVDLAKRRIVAQGVPEEAVEILAPPVAGTISEAQLVARLAGPRHYQALMIVTSPHHTRRAYWSFEREFGQRGLSTRLGVAPALQGYEGVPAASWWLRASGWRTVGVEYAKALFYWVAY